MPTLTQPGEVGPVLSHFLAVRGGVPVFDALEEVSTLLAVACDQILALAADRDSCIEWGPYYTAAIAKGLLDSAITGLLKEKTHHG